MYIYVYIYICIQIFKYIYIVPNLKQVRQNKNHQKKCWYKSSNFETFGVEKKWHLILLGK